MAVTPDGMISLPIYYGRLLVADSATFRTWVGASTQAEALARLYFNKETSPVRPFGDMGWDGDWTREAIAGGERNYFEQTAGGLLLMFEEDIAAGLDEADAYFTFTNTVGAIIKEMEERAGTAGYLDMVSIAVHSGPARPSEDEKQTLGDYYQVLYKIEFRGI
jgi:hypothetical protein